MAALAEAQQEKGAEFLAALQKRASKKPMPSAMKGNKGKKSAGNRRRITFVDSDADDENDAADNINHEDGGAASDEDANGRSKKAESKGKGGNKGKKESAKGRNSANVENVKKLVDLGDGWKRRVNADEEEDEIEDDLDDGMVRCLHLLLCTFGHGYRFCCTVHDCLMLLLCLRCGCCFNLT